ncbi:hypothetical protein FIBSPDRAFT_296939 [Athelia psychrophila]|uniref:Uncharacterized protein n=1 Tax=Athelia psychrophila TaxID=1759441 RepID=A0A167X9M6_9AGAM|nr:hypothetical protein FIBSPDRAFT_296939 [Fibularhizoctonia sp. CBS 109695]
MRKTKTDEGWFLTHTKTAPLANSTYTGRRGSGCPFAKHPRRHARCPSVHAALRPAQTYNRTWQRLHVHPAHPRVFPAPMSLLHPFPPSLVRYLMQARPPRMSPCACSLPPHRQRIRFSPGRMGVEGSRTRRRLAPRTPRRF